MRLLKFLQALQDLVFPTSCLHCHQDLDPDMKLLCFSCFIQLELITPQKRCPICFTDDFLPQQKICFTCRSRYSYLDASAAAFEYKGVAAALVQQMKYQNKPFLSQGLASFLTMQLMHLKWLKPDYIVAVPIPITKWFTRGYNQSQLLAEAMAKMIESPYASAIGRKAGGYSQAKLAKGERNILAEKHFVFREKISFTDKVILLVDDVRTTGTTLERCAQELRRANPKKIYALTVCRTIEEIGKKG